LLRAKGKSRSSTTLAAAFNLRQYTQHSGKGQLEPARIYSDVLMDTEKAAATRRRSAELQEAWRLREDEERGIPQAKARQANLSLQQEKDRKAATRAQRLYDKEVHTANVSRKAREEEARVRKEREELRIEQEYEAARLKRETADAERARRMPWPCDNCKATGKCISCQGKGHHMGVFLVSKLNMNAANHPLEFGSKAQGCQTCGGLVPGIRGRSEQGTGVCTVCEGHGLIWPNLDKPKDEKRLTRSRTMARKSRDDGDDDGEPFSPAYGKSRATSDGW